jgi:ABC-type nitrate/sulfonate/bicarbonate transport system permease component
MSGTTDLDAPAADSATAGPAAAPSQTGTHLLQLLCFLVVVAIWALISALHLISGTALPSPLATVAKFVTLLGQADFWDAVGATLRGAVVGLLASAVVGIPLGLVTGTYPAAEESSRLAVDFLRSFPVIALLPVFLLVLGSTPAMKATVVFIACVFPVFLQAQYGARSVPPMIAETVQAYRIPRLLRFRRVILPSATPSIMTGLRLAATTSVLVAIGVEILTTLPGIGHEVTQQQQGGNSDVAFAYIFTAGILGYGINRAAMFVEKSLLRWRPPAHP